MESWRSRLPNLGDPQEDSPQPGESTDSTPMCWRHKSGHLGIDDDARHVDRNIEGFIRKSEQNVSSLYLLKQSGWFWSLNSTEIMYLSTSLTPSETPTLFHSFPMMIYHSYHIQIIKNGQKCHEEMLQMQPNDQKRQLEASYGLS